MKLTLRDCFWLIAIVAVIAGWWVDRQRLAVMHAKEIKLLERFDQAGTELLRDIRTALEREGYQEEWDGDNLTLRKTPESASP